jgi:hypothetical protein
MRFAAHVARIGVKKDTYGILVRKPEGMRPLGRPSLRRVDSFKIGLRER